MTCAKPQLAATAPEDREAQAEVFQDSTGLARSRCASLAPSSLESSGRSLTQRHVNFGRWVSAPHVGLSAPPVGLVRRRSRLAGESACTALICIRQVARLTSEG